MLPTANHVKLTNPLFLRGRASAVDLNRWNQMILFYTPHIYKQEKKQHSWLYGGALMPLGMGSTPINAE